MASLRKTEQVVDSAYSLPGYQGKRSEKIVAVIFSISSTFHFLVGDFGNGDSAVAVPLRDGRDRRVVRDGLHEGGTKLFTCTHI